MADGSQDSKRTSYSVSLLNWPGAFLSAAIICIRAFQPNAELMSEWTWQSWALMLLPSYVGFALAAVFGAAALLGLSAAAICTCFKRKC